jgi:hypothetical protein
LKPFDESGIWDRGMDPFPPSRAEAVRLARDRGEGLGEKCLSPGSPRRLQPIVDKFFYGLYANQIEDATTRVVVGESDARNATTAQEKLTLFWHGHFATGENKVRDYRMMLQQNLMLRAQRLWPASGSADRNPQGSGDARLSRQRREREVASERKLRRELLELFSMGVGNYTEHDVREAGARVHRLDQRRPHL